MCRFAGFVGQDSPLSSLLFDPIHSLERQAYAPEKMVRGHVNVDGTGVAWWPEAEAMPMRYITERPPWSDPNLAALSSRLRATTALAAVRSATPGMPFGPDHVQPFVIDEWAGVHNGWIGGFGTGLVRDLLEPLPDDLVADLGVINDSRVLFMRAVALLREGLDPARAVAKSVLDVAAIVAKRGESATLNFAIASRDRIVAVRHSSDSPPNSLFVQRGHNQNVVASEPLDGVDEAWEQVPAGHVADIGLGGVKISPIDEVA